MFPLRNKMLIRKRSSDPCCGSGNFLIETVKQIFSHDETIERKLEAINNVYGYDINPISIYVSKLNLLYLLKDYIADIHLNLYVLDFLFHEEKDVNTKFDLIIGNPPWYTYRDIETIDYQNKVKELSEEWKKTKEHSYIQQAISTAKQIKDGKAQSFLEILLALAKAST